MQPAVVFIGIGEVAGVFARGFLRIGRSLIPVRRQDDIETIAGLHPNPELVVLAVAEKDFDSALQQVPTTWRDRLLLLQNELLPGSWQQYGLDDPTVISVWFEKKPGQDYKVLVPSPVYGPHAALVAEALGALNIPTDVLDSQQRLLLELVRKNMFILTTNVCGLQTGGTVSELWNQDTTLMNRVFDDVLAIQQAITGEVFDRDPMLNSVLTAFDADPDHRCMGRSAPARLERALQTAQEYGVDTPELKRIANALAAKQG
jgi:ketopantoate reductase